MRPPVYGVSLCNPITLSRVRTLAGLSIIRPFRASVWIHEGVVRSSREILSGLPKKVEKWEN